MVGEMVGGKRALLTLKNTAEKKTQQKKKNSQRKRAKCCDTAWRAGEFMKSSDVTSYLTPSSSLTPHRPTSSYLSHSSPPPVILSRYSVMAQSPTHLDGKSKNTVLPQAPPVASFSNDPLGREPCSADPWHPSRKLNHTITISCLTFCNPSWTGGRRERGILSLMQDLAA